MESKNLIEMDTTKLDAIGIVDGHLELLLIDENQWFFELEKDHFQKLEEKINNYIHYIETKQYVDRYGDDFTEKVIYISCQYNPSDKGIAYFAAVQKALKDTDINLKIELPE